MSHQCLRSCATSYSVQLLKRNRSVLRDGLLLIKLFVFTVHKVSRNQENVQIIFKLKMYKVFDFYS